MKARTVRPGEISAETAAKIRRYCEEAHGGLTLAGFMERIGQALPANDQPLDVADAAAEVAEAIGPVRATETGAFFEDIEDRPAVEWRIDGDLVYLLRETPGGDLVSDMTVTVAECPPFDDERPYDPSKRRARRIAHRLWQRLESGRLTGREP